jgi:hypothetical protein
VHLPAGGSGVGAGNVTSTLVLSLTVVLQLLITSAVIQADGGGVLDHNKILYHC